MLKEEEDGDAVEIDDPVSRSRSETEAASLAEVWLIWKAPSQESRGISLSYFAGTPLGMPNILAWAFACELVASCAEAGSSSRIPSKSVPLCGQIAGETQDKR